MVPVDLPSGLIQAFIQHAEEAAIYASPYKFLSSRRTATFLFLSVAPEGDICVGRSCHFHIKPKANIKIKIENSIRNSPEPKPIHNPGGFAVPMFISYTQLF